jgi:3-hydroxyisobutyrate dehydrogenase-like beta-hydroxyacid dehydrogenase
MTRWPSVAVIGSGNMGGALVGRLCEHGVAVSVCDPDAQRQTQAQAVGAQVMTTPVAAVQGLGSDGVVLIVVVNDAQCEDVLWGEHGAASVLQPGHTVVLCPTLAPEAVESIADRLSHVGVACVDAPMSGGPLRARSGTMSWMLAAPKAVLARHPELWGLLANPVFHVSERCGDGARTKLVNNLLAAINLVGAAEALALAERMGLNLNTTLDVIERSSGQSWIGSDRMRRAVVGDFAPRAHVTLLEKDTGLAMAAAQYVGFEGPLGRHAAAVFAQTRQAGWAEHDDGAVFAHLRGDAPPAKPSTP